MCTPFAGGGLSAAGEGVTVAAVAAVFVLPPEVTTAMLTAARTSTAVIAMIPRSCDLLEGKSGLRMPMSSDRVSAHATSSPPAM